MEENMRASIAHTMSRSLPAAMIGVWVVAVGAPTPTCANVITDWDEQAVAATAPMINLAGGAPYTAQRMLGMVHVAMFDAVNSIEPRYRPYLVQLPAAATTSKEAAAAAAAAVVVVQRQTGAVVDAGAFKGAARLDTEYVVNAIPVLIDPFADGVTLVGRLDLLGPVTAIGENATTVVDFVDEDVGGFWRDDILLRIERLHHHRHSVRAAAITGGIALPALGLVRETRL
jgi:hypothetical protein